MPTETKMVTFLLHEVRAALMKCAEDNMMHRLQVRSVSRMTGGDQDLNCIVDEYTTALLRSAAILLVRKAIGEGWGVAGDVEVLPLKQRGDMEPYWRVTAFRSWRVEVK